MPPNWLEALGYATFSDPAIALGEPGAERLIGRHV